MIKDNESERKNQEIISSASDSPDGAVILPLQKGHISLASGADFICYYLWPFAG